MELTTRTLWGLEKTYCTMLPTDTEHTHTWHIYMLKITNNRRRLERSLQEEKTPPPRVTFRSWTTDKKTIYDEH